MNAAEGARAASLARAALALEPPEVERAQRLYARATSLAPLDAAVAAAARDCHVVAEALSAARGGEPALARLLGVPLGASAAELHAAAKRLALRLHPDKNCAPCAAGAFAEVRAAVDKLAQRRSLGAGADPAGSCWRGTMGGAEAPAVIEATCMHCAHVSAVLSRACSSSGA